VQTARWNLRRIRFGTLPGWAPGTTPTSAQREALRGDEIVVVGPGTSTAGRTEYPSVFWGPKWHRVREVHHGVAIDVLHMHRRPGDRVPRERKGQLYRDVPGRVLEISREVVELLDLMGQAVPPDGRITVVQGPLRTRVAEFHPDTVVVSDQMLEIFPARRFVRFHAVVLARAVLDMLVRRSYVDRHDPSTDLWLPGAVSFAMLKLWERKQAHPDEFAHDILRNVTFVPAVDRFLYTAQASFADAYFRGSEDHMPLRNHPLWFGHELPTGRRIHEKLKDTLGTRKLARFYQAMVDNPSIDPKRAAEVAYGFDLGWFFDQWLGTHPSVDYAIKAVEGEKHGERWRYRITIEQVGERPVIQPVQVLVTERGGERHYLVWNGELAASSEDPGTTPRRGTHTWEIETTRKVRTVQLDPRDRVVETAQPPAENVDPLFNNRRPKAARFLYTGAGLSIAASEFVAAETNAARFNAIAGFVSFEGSLRRDLRRTGHLLLMHNRENVVGADGGAVLRFGRKTNRRRRRIRVPVFGSVAWLTDRSLGSLDDEGGVRVGQSLAITDDTRRFSWWPERGHRLSLSAGARQTLRVGTTAEGADAGSEDNRYDLVVGAAWVQLWRLAHDHVLASQLSMGMVIPLADSRPEFRSLLRGGGIGALAGYAADEIFGLAQALAQLEYRHVYLNNMRGNLVHLAWLRSIGGTFFTGAATVSGCEDYGGWFGKDSFYGHVGYGLVAYLQVLGVTPQLFRLDLAVPLVRRDPVDCLDVQLPQHLADVQGLDDATGLLRPFNINVTFTQPF
jgi:hypothetical protein